MTIHPRDGHNSRTVIGFALQLSPVAGTIVGNDVFEHGGEGICVDGFALADGELNRAFACIFQRSAVMGPYTERQLGPGYRPRSG